MPLRALYNYRSIVGSPVNGFMIRKRSENERISDFLRPWYILVFFSGVVHREEIWVSILVLRGQERGNPRQVQCLDLIILVHPSYVLFQFTNAYFTLHFNSIAF
jgi:hypothetical protein